MEFKKLNLTDDEIKCLILFANEALKNSRVGEIEDNIKRCFLYSYVTVDMENNIKKIINKFLIKEKDE